MKIYEIKVLEDETIVFEDKVGVKINQPYKVQFGYLEFRRSNKGLHFVVKDENWKFKYVVMTSKPGSEIGCGPRRVKANTSHPQPGSGRSENGCGPRRIKTISGTTLPFRQVSDDGRGSCLIFMVLGFFRDVIDIKM